MATEKIKLLLSAVDEIRSNMVTKDDLRSLIDMITTQQKKIESLEGHVSVLQNTVKLLKRGQDDQEQYSRRQCLRIFGVPKSAKETPEDCLKTVRNLITEVGLDIPDVTLDRAHRIGNARGDKPPAIVVKFTNFRHRTALYKKRKVIRDRCKYSVQLDLTRERLALLNEARALLSSKSASRDDFVFADINCVVTAKVGQRFHKISSIEDLEGLFS